MTKNDAGESGLLVTARTKPYAPPFMMLGLNLENTTSSDFRITATARYLAFGVLTLGLRAANRRHAGVGSRRLGRVLSADCLERLLRRALCRGHHRRPST